MSSNDVSCTCRATLVSLPPNIAVKKMATTVELLCDEAFTPMLLPNRSKRSQQLRISLNNKRLVCCRSEFFRLLVRLLTDALRNKLRGYSDGGTCVVGVLKVKNWFERKKEITESLFIT